MSTRKPRDYVATTTLIAGESCAMLLLAPAEYLGAVYVGFPRATAWCVTGLVYAVVTAAIRVGRLIPFAFSLIWASGLAGVIHQAQERARLDKVPLDRARVLLAVFVVSLIVAAMVGLWQLSRWMHDRVAKADADDAEKRATEDQERRQAQERAEQQRQYRRLQAERQAHELAQEAAEASHRRAVELAQARASSEVQEAAERAVAEAEALAELSHRRADELAAELAQERTERAVELAQARAELTALAVQPTARREPKRRPTRTAKTQVTAEIAEGLTDSEVAVLSYMLGRGPVQRQTVVEDTGIPLGTVKRAVAQLAVKGHVVACAARGQYRSVSPDLATDEPMAASE